MVYPLEPATRRCSGSTIARCPEQRRGGRCGRATSARTVLAGPVDLGRAGAASSPARRSSSTTAARERGVLGPRFGGDRRGGALPRRAGSRDPSLAARRGAGRARRAGRRRRGFFGDPAVLGAGPGDRRGRRCLGAWQIAAVPEGGWQRAAGALGAARALRARRAADRRADPRRGRLVASRQAKLALIRDREAELSRLSWRLEFALRPQGRGLGRRPRHRPTALGRADQGSSSAFPSATGYFGEADWIGRAASRRPRAARSRRRTRRWHGDGRFVVRLPHRAAGRRGAARPRHGRALQGEDGRAGWSGWSGT